MRRSQLAWLGGLALALALTVPAWLPWLNPRLNLWAVDDAKNHMLRLYVLEWQVRHGVLFPRWVSDLYMGYGYPLLNFYAPAAYYVGLLSKLLLGLDVWDAFKAIGVVAALLGAAGAYTLTVAVWRRVELGVVAALGFLYGPYAFQINLYKRGDVPEALGLTILPWILWGVVRVWRAPSGARQALAGVGLALPIMAVLLTHNLTAIVGAALGAVWVAFWLLCQPRRGALLWTLAAALLAAGATSFFWLPAVGEVRLVWADRLREGQLDYRGWLLDPGGNAPRQQDPRNRQTPGGLFDLHLHYPHHAVLPDSIIAAPKLGLAQAGLGALALASLALGVLNIRRRNGPRAAAGAGAGENGVIRFAALPLLLVAVAGWLLTFTFSDPVWRAVPGLMFFQFPWRFLGPVVLCLSIAGAGALALPLSLAERRWTRAGPWPGYAVAAAASGAILFNGLGGRALLIQDVGTRAIDREQFMTDERGDRLGVGTTTTNLEFLPSDVQVAVYTNGFPRDEQLFERLYPERDWLGGLLRPLEGSMRVLAWRNGAQWLRARVANDGTQPALLGVHQLRFPGWHAWIDGRAVDVGVAPYVPEQQAAPGFITVEVPPGEHTVTVAFGPSPLRLAGIAVSALAGLALIGLFAGALWLGGPPAGRWVGAVGGLLLVLALGWATWRAVRPLAPELWLPAPVPPPQSGGLWYGAGLGRNEGGLLVQVAEAARSGAARIESPSGAALGRDKFVDVRSLRVVDENDPERGRAGVSEREWLYEHPPSSVAVDVALPAGQEVWFQAALALDPDVWRASTGDGVRFQCSLAPLDAGGAPGPATLLVDRVVNPRARGEDRRWLPVALDLSAWGGKTVRLTLRTLPENDLTFDWAGWADPVVMVRQSARAFGAGAGQ